MTLRPTPAPTTWPVADTASLATAYADDPADATQQTALALWRLLHATPTIRRRFQFYVWAQTHLQPLLPHTVLVCGAYHRQRRDLVYDVFHNVVLPEPVLQSLSDPAGALMRTVCQRWIEADGQPLRLALDGSDDVLPPDSREALSVLTHDSLLVHGVTRPQRPSEIETLFLFAGWPQSRPRAELAAQMAPRLDLLLPHLHRLWQRVVQAEQDMLRGTGRPAARATRVPVEPSPRDDPPITVRERQILCWVRDGLSNQAIALTLDISPLTVKNHVQKILRKLGAANRTQAVAQALSQGLIPNGDHERPDATTRST
ncbi:MAG: hypothetical protein RLY78_195 [Pseudomonadota bacterium]